MMAAAHCPPRSAPRTTSSSADRPGPDLILHPGVVDRRLAVVEIAHQRFPALEAVVDGACGKTGVSATTLILSST